jgi:putative ABC transport system permease protein
VALIIITLVMYKQISFTQNQDLGMNIENVIAIRALGFSDQKTDLAYDRFKQTLLTNPGILGASVSLSIPGERFGYGNYGEIYRQGSNVHDNYFRIGRVDSNFVHVFDIKLLAGQNFMNESENQNAVIINQEAMKVLKFENAEDAVGKLLRWNGRPIKIIGVVDDFHQESFYKTIEPIVLYDKAFDQYIDYISIRFDRHDAGKQLPFIENTYKTIFPDQPFEYFFLDDFYNQQYKTDFISGKLIMGFSFLAIMIAVLGLFNLISYSVTRRIKEIGVRKVIGATSFNIVTLLTKDYIKWVLIANIVAWPVAWFAMNKWLQNFAYRIDLTIWPFLLSGLMALMIALLTVSWQAIRAARANPIESLRYE